MKTKILAAVGTIGLVLATLAIATLGDDAEAQTIATPSVAEAGDLTGPQAACFGAVAESIWEECVKGNIHKFDLYKTDRMIDGELNHLVEARAIEYVTTDAAVFAALDKAIDLVVLNRKHGCTITQDGSDVTYCIERGPTVLTQAQVTAGKACAVAVVGALGDVVELNLLNGTPRTFRAKHANELTPSNYAACRIAGTCQKAD